MALVVVFPVWLDLLCLQRNVGNCHRKLYYLQWVIDCLSYNESTTGSESP